MDSRLIKIIYDYRAAVETAIHFLVQAGIPKPASAQAWARLDIPRQGTLVGHITYYKHGHGCLVNLPSGAVDFDFGDDGKINPFNEWRLTCFAKERLQQYGFESELELELAIELAVEDGVLSNEHDVKLRNFYS